MSIGRPVTEKVLARPYAALGVPYTNVARTIFHFIRKADAKPNLATTDIQPPSMVAL